MTGAAHATRYGDGFVTGRCLPIARVSDRTAHDMRKRPIEAFRADGAWRSHSKKMRASCHERPPERRNGMLGGSSPRIMRASIKSTLLVSIRADSGLATTDSSVAIVIADTRTHTLSSSFGIESIRSARGAASRS
jgi:hypothetical protein